MITQLRHISRASGFTLTETLMSSALLGVLLVAMGSAITLSSHAVPSPDQAGHGRIAAVRAMEQLTADLSHATFVLDRSPTSVTLVVPDRTGDAKAERITYAWSGVAGDPLTRQINASDPRPVLEGVQRFALSYELNRRSRTYAAPVVEDSSESWIAGTGSLLDLTAAAVTQTSWIGQYVNPNLPHDVISWRPTRASFHANTRSQGPTWIRLMMADDNGRPTDTLLAHVTADSGDFGGTLNTLAEEQVTFETAEQVPAGKPVALVIRSDGSSDPANVAYQLGANRVRTTDGGASWSHSSTYGMVFGLWGVLTRQGEPQTSGFDHVTTVGIELASVDDPAAAVRSRVHLRNEPAVLAAAWDLDFQADPEAVDITGDGTADWELQEEEVFGYIGDDTSTGGSGTSGTGKWTVSDPLHSAPLNDFAGLTVVEVRMRHQTTGTDGAVFHIFANRLDGEAAELKLQLMKQSDGSQTLTLSNPGASNETLKVVPALRAGFITLGMVIDPTYGTVHLRIDDRPHGTYAYQRSSATTSERYAALTGDADAAEFDFVRIRVGP